MKQAGGVEKKSEAVRFGQSKFVQPSSTNYALNGQSSQLSPLLPSARIPVSRRDIHREQLRNPRTHNKVRPGREQLTHTFTHRVSVPTSASINASGTWALLRWLCDCLSEAKLVHLPALDPVTRIMASSHILLDTVHPVLYLPAVYRLGAF